MSRRHRAPQRTVIKDPVYGSELVTAFIKKVMLHGKRTLAEKIVYGAMKKLSLNINIESPLEAFEKALENGKPSVEVKSRKIGGATYQVPIEIREPRRISLSMKWLISHARQKPGRSMIDALAQEMTDCFNNQGSTINKKETTHRNAEANKAFAQYKW